MNWKLVIYPKAKSDKPINTVVFEDQSEQTTSIAVSNIKVGDFFKGDFYGYYAVVMGESYGDEIEISYFQKREKNFVIKENNFDSWLIIELKRVQGNLVYTRGHTALKNSYIWFLNFLNT